MTDDRHRPNTYADVIRTALGRYPSQTAFVHEGRTLTYAQAADFLGRTMRVFTDHGFGRGNGVAVLSTNRPEAWLAAGAGVMLGGCYTALHPLGSIDDFRYICADADIHTLVFDPAAFDKKVATLLGDEKLPNVLALGRSSVAPDLLTLVEKAAPCALTSTASPSDVSAVLYTRGTTGRPKGVALSQRVWSNTILTVSSDFELPACPRYLAASPITHASGMMIVPTLLRGGTVYLHPGFDPGRFLGTIESERINLCFGVPTMIYVLLDHPALAQTDVSSLETF